MPSPTERVRKDLQATAAAVAMTLALLAFAATSFAGPAPAVSQPSVPLAPGHIPPPSKTPPGTVTTGVYLYAVHELDFAKHTFHPVFEIWWRWRGDDFDPLATLALVSNRGAPNVTLEDRRKLGNGENYAVARVDAIVNQMLDTSTFPFDRHRLRIEIESPYEDEYLNFAVDRESSLLDPDAFSPGWRLQNFSIHEERVQYPTTFGLKERANNRYSRVVVEVYAERIGWRIAVDYFIGFIVSALISMLGYLIPPRELSVRVSLAMTATFTAVGNKYVVNTLTETSVSARLANVAIVTSFGMILALIATSIVCERMIVAGHGDRAIRLNRNVGAAAVTAYALVIAFFIWRALRTSATG